MLLYRAGTDVELACDLLVAATLDQQSQHLLIARRNLDFVEVDHLSLSAPSVHSLSAESWGREPPEVDARDSPNVR